jgi:hypothetical protein
MKTKRETKLVKHKSQISISIMSKNFLDMNLGINFSSLTESLPGLLRTNESKLDFIWKNLINLISIEDSLISSISYAQVIKYFISDKPNNSAIKKGAILVENHSQGYLVTQVFLDASNNLVCHQDGRPYGRRLVVDDLDDELRDVLGDKNLIIVE